MARHMLMRNDGTLTVVHIAIAYKDKHFALQLVAHLYHVWSQLMLKEAVVPCVQRCIFQNLLTSLLRRQITEEKMNMIALNGQHPVRMIFSTIEKWVILKLTTGKATDLGPVKMRLFIQLHGWQSL